MVVVSMLPHAEIGGNDHREDAPQFTYGPVHRLAPVKLTSIAVEKTNFCVGVK